jgi:DNA-binding transcriptional regulator LsrR (DeoR family)
MARPRSRPDLHLLSKVSTLYYLRDHTQQQIADRLHISRPKVSRLLQEAQDRGIVRITLTPPAGLHLELESALETAFGLEEVQVVDVDAEHPETVNRQIGASAANYLGRTLQPGDVVGLGWGSTLKAMVEAMSPVSVHGTVVVQTLGGVGAPDSEVYAGRLVRRLADLVGGTPVLLPAPGIVGTAEVRDALRNDHHVRLALQKFDSLDTVFVGLSSLESSPVLHDGRSLPTGSYEELKRLGAVGHLALHFYDSNGSPLSTPFDDRVLGISVEQLARVKRVVAVAGGPEKVDAILAALRGGILDVLITDRLTAEALADRAAPPTHFEGDSPYPLQRGRRAGWAVPDAPSERANGGSAHRRARDAQAV